MRRWAKGRLPEYSSPQPSQLTEKDTIILADFNNTTLPRHAQVGFTTDCVRCHSTISWNSAYDHARTQFPLTGAHRAATCQQCHADGVYQGKPTDCASCHTADYNTAANPRHTKYLYYVRRPDKVHHAFFTNKADFDAYQVKHGY